MITSIAEKTIQFHSIVRSIDFRDIKQTLVRAKTLVEDAEYFSRNPNWAMVDYNMKLDLNTQLDSTIFFRDRIN